MLIVGVPAAGKTRLMNEVKEAFQQYQPPVSAPHQPVGIPAGSAGTLGAIIPSSHKRNRRVFEMTMSPNVQFGHVWRALEADPQARGLSFRVSRGLMWQANEHAIEPDGTALLCIDEFNRGPTAQMLGPALAALESDKRLDPPTNGVVPSTVSFALPDDAGVLDEYALSAHFYVLAAMNNADTSVETIDTATLRRFAPVTLAPDRGVLDSHFGLAGAAAPTSPASSSAQVYTALVDAWEGVNQRLAIGRGNDDYLLGHGALMHRSPPATPVEALTYAREAWERVERHVLEVFFGDPEGQAAALAVYDVTNHPYTFETRTFGPREVDRLLRPALDDATFYELLRKVAVPVVP